LVNSKLKEDHSQKFGVSKDNTIIENYMDREKV